MNSSLECPPWQQERTSNMLPYPFSGDWLPVAAERITIAAPSQSSLSTMIDSTAKEVPLITKEPGRCGGDACIRNTRLTVWGLLEWKRLGWSDRKILDNYPQLNQDDLAAAWLYADQHQDEINDAIRDNEEA